MEMLVSTAGESIHTEAKTVGGGGCGRLKSKLRTWPAGTVHVDGIKRFFFGHQHFS